MAARPEYPTVQLSTDDVAPGPWIYGRQVDGRAPAPPDGALAEVLDASGRFIGHGLYNGASDIRVRLLSRGRRTDLDRPREFLLARIRAADRLRRRTLRLPEVTDAYRIVHAEGDDLPGLIVDHLGGTLVCEHHSLGFWELRETIEWCLGELYPGAPVVHRVPPAAARAEGFEPPPPPESEPVVLQEHGLSWRVVPGRGHKTGWFCDQRDNRLEVGRLATGRDVLDLCCNRGGFALRAASLGARRVVGVDLDEDAIAGAEDAAKLNGLEVELVHADAFHVLRDVREATGGPSLVVLDPHKLVAGKRDLESGMRKYHDLNTLALEVVQGGGLVATFSCSGAVSEEAFVGMVFQAARRAERSVRLLRSFGASPDHPQRPDFRRSRYLKGCLLAVDENRGRGR